MFMNEIFNLNKKVFLEEIKISGNGAIIENNGSDSMTDVEVNHRWK